MKRLMMSLIILALVAFVTACSSSSSNTASEHAGHDMAHMEETEKIMVHMNWKLTSESLVPNQETTLTIKVRGHDTPYIEDFDVIHEKKMHLIVVSKDLSYFAHLHPTYEGKGVFRVALNVPQAGEYTMFADFKPTGSAQVAERHTMTAVGTAPVAKSLVVDNTIVKEMAGKNVALAIDTLQAGEEATLTFSFKDMLTGKPVKDLEQYLGAIGHVVIISADTQKYLHVHPADDSEKGPTATFMTTFDTPGLYKAWGQFQHKGEVFTVPFTLEVTK